MIENAKQCAPMVTLYQVTSIVTYIIESVYLFVYLIVVRRQTKYLTHVQLM